MEQNAIKLELFGIIRTLSKLLNNASSRDWYNI